MPVGSPQLPPPPMPTWQFAVRALLAVALALGGFALALFLWHSIYILILIFLGILVAVFLRSLADWLDNALGLGPNWSLVLVVLGLLAISVVSGVLMWSPLTQQAEQLRERLPQSLETLRGYIQRTAVGQYLLDGQAQAADMIPATQEVVRQATGWVTTTFTAIAAVFIVFFIGLYLAATPAMYLDGALRVLPPKYRPRGAEVFYAIGYTLRWWLVGRTISAIIVGILTGTALWIAGIPLPLVLGVLAALLEFIPNIGPIIAAIPAVLLALTLEPSKVLWVAIIYTIIQQLESYVITPIVERKAVLLPPALTITVQVLLGLLIGVPGLLVATPLMAVVLVSTKMLYVEDVLGEEMETPDDQLKEPPETLQRVHEETEPRNDTAPRDLPPPSPKSDREQSQRTDESEKEQK